VARYITKRLVLLVIIIVFVSVATFFLVHLLPGNPTDTILGPNATPQNVATLNRELGLNRPLWQQYFVWIGHLLTGHLGDSFISHTSISATIRAALPIDLELILISQVLAFGIAIPTCDPFVAPLLYAIPVQLLAYHTAVVKGTDVDQPRNLAKSVTVE